MKRGTAEFGVVDQVNKDSPIQVDNVDLEVPDSLRDSEKDLPLDDPRLQISVK